MFGRGGSRSHWAALGAAIAVTLGTGGVLTSSASAPAAPSSFVPITPCRLLDTRPAPDNVGPRSAPLGAHTTFTAMAWGVNGNCVIPAGATALSMNLAAVNPTASSYMTVFPADSSLPLAANLNYIAGQPPTPNSVTAALSTDGRISFYNLTGTVDIAVDVVGYFVADRDEELY